MSLSIDDVTKSLLACLTNIPAVTVAAYAAASLSRAKQDSDFFNADLKTGYLGGVMSDGTETIGTWGRFTAAYVAAANDFVNQPPLPTPPAPPKAYEPQLQMVDGKTWYPLAMIGSTDVCAMPALPVVPERPPAGTISIIHSTDESKTTWNGVAADRMKYPKGFPVYLVSESLVLRFFPWTFGTIWQTDPTTPPNANMPIAVLLPTKV